MKICLTLVWTVLVPLILFFVLDEIYSKRSIELSRNWINVDSKSHESGHMSSTLARYQRLIISSDFIQGVSIYDSSLKIVSSFGYVNSHFIPSFPGKNQISFHRTGLFSYNTTFIMGTFDQKYLVTFFFNSAIGQTTLLGISLLLIGLFLTFALINFWQNKIEMNKRVSIVVRAIESYAHDIGNTLNWAKELVECLEKNENTKLNDLSQYVKKSLKFAHDLRIEMLSISKPSLEETQSLDLKEIYFQTRAISVSDLSKFTIVEKFHHTNLIQGDEIKLSRVIMNLLQNAYNHSAGYICVSTKNYNEGILFEIANDGIGIPKKIINDVFKPFVTTNGSGLGLYICKTFIELHGGYIQVNSDTNFTKLVFWIPATSQKLVSSKKIKVNTHNLSIALIDDEQRQLDRIKASLQTPHTQIETFTHVDYFYSRLLENKHFDIVVIDRIGPGFDAIRDSFCKVLRDEFEFKGKIILYSNSLLKNDEKCNFDHFLSKNQKLTLDFLLKLQRS